MTSGADAATWRHRGELPERRWRPPETAARTNRTAGDDHAHLLWFIRVYGYTGYMCGPHYSLRASSQWLWDIKSETTFKLSNTTHNDDKVPLLRLISVALVGPFSCQASGIRLCNYSSFESSIQNLDVNL